MHPLKKINILRYGLLVSTFMVGGLLAMDKSEPVGGANANQQTEKTFDSQKKEIEELTRQLEESRLKNQILKLRLELQAQHEENNKLVQQLAQKTTDGEKSKQVLPSSSITTNTQMQTWRERLKVTTETEEKIKSHLKSLGLAETDQLMEVCQVCNKMGIFPALEELQSKDNAATWLKSLNVPSLTSYKIQGAETCLTHFPDLKGQPLIDRLVVAVYFAMASKRTKNIKQDIEDALSNFKITKEDGESITQYVKFYNILFDSKFS